MCDALNALITKAFRASLFLMVVMNETLNIQ
jgi:hypothetical protein